MKRWAVLALLAAPRLAAAEPADTDLRLRAIPDRPVRLQMRAAPSSVPTGPARRGPPLPPIRRPAANAAVVSPAPGRPSAFQSLDEAPDRDVVFRFDLGYAVDGGSLVDEVDNDANTPCSEPRATHPTLAGADLRCERDYEGVRGYGLGDLYLGSRGVGHESLSTYFAARARLARSADMVAIPTVYDAADDVQIRALWAETDELFESRWLAPLRVRAGRQFVYGPAIAHLTGLLLAWEARGLEVRAYSGYRVADYYASEGRRGRSDDDYNGIDARIDFGAWRLIPLVLTAGIVGHASHTHTEVSAAYARPRKDLVIRASARSIDGRRARERATARIQISDVTQVTVDIDHRTASDWRWDPEWVRADRDIDGDRYLWLGPVTPRVSASVRAGTVFLDNVDFLLRAAGAVDTSSRSAPPGPFTADWVEAGSTLEVRLRRAIAIGASGLLRGYDRERVETIVDVEATDLAARACMPGQPSTCPSQRLPPLSHLGERNLQQLSIHLRYTTGARRFSASAEIYSRRTRFVQTYVDDVDVPDDPGEPGDETTARGFDVPRDDIDRRGGGRFTIEAWPRPNLRILAEYDLSTIIEIAPEIHGYKSLRLLVEASW